MSPLLRRPVRTAIRAITVSAVIASSGFAVVHLAPVRDDHAATTATPSRPAAPASYRFERLTTPNRTVVRDEDGAIVAILTDGARTAVLTGPTRTFREPSRTPAAVTTSSWVRLLPQPWQPGATWFEPWLKKALADWSEDLLAIAAEYLEGAPAQTDGKGVRFRGDAASARRDRPADFFDYLGTSWSFPGGKTEQPHADRAAALDSGGFVRLVYGYRLGYPLRDTADHGTGLPRTPAAMALDGGTVIIPDKHTTPADRMLLLPGDLLFFDDRRAGAGDVNHVGIFLGVDDSGNPRFVSSRRKANGPTFGDVGPTSLFGKGGRFGPGLRSARRL